MKLIRLGYSASPNFAGFVEKKVKKQTDERIFLCNVPQFSELKTRYILLLDQKENIISLHYNRRMSKLNPKSSQVARLKISFEFWSRIAIFLATFVLVICKSQTMSARSPLGSTLETVGDRYYVKKCQNDEEFHCTSENKCIPKEWVCDLNEQCLGSEDEFGCSPQFCTFENNLCNWKNEFKSVHQGENLIAWRRYRNSIGHNSRAQIDFSKQTSSSTSYKNALTSQPNVNQIIQAKIDEFNSKATPNTNFIFTPLIFSNNPPTQENSVEQYAGKSENRTRNLIRSSSFKSPFISQTNSMCELRFKYALWSKLFNSVKENPLKIILTLEVKLYEHFPLNSTSNLSDKSTRHSADKVKVLWSKSIESSSIPVPPTMETSPTPESTFGGEEVEWLVGVVELGHLKQIEIGFDAKLTVIPLDDMNVRGNENKPQEKSKARGDRILPAGHQQHKEQGGDMIMEMDSRQQTQQQQQLVLKRLPHASIVALNWFRFQGCAWPQGKHENSLYLNLADQMDSVHTHVNPNFRDGPQLNEKSNPTNNTLANKQLEEDKTPRREISDHGDTNINLLDYDVGGHNDEQQLNSCRTSEFQCQNSICLEEHRLCNFVNDCMNESPTQSEDEHRDLCQNVPGMEDFESLSLTEDENSENYPVESGEVEITREEAMTTTRATIAEETTKRPFISRKLSKFWILTSNWPTDKIRVQNSKLSSKLHLPRRDHTLKSAKGHYLSLEVPRHINAFSAPTNNIRYSRNGENSLNVYWTYLSSVWMRRLDPERGECRIKFFYNIVSDRPNIGTALQRGQTFKIYLAVEHIVAKEANETGEEKFEGTRKIDKLMYSHLKDYEDSNLIGRGSLIEYPGVEFWREVNYELVGLEKGDLFYVRIAIIVETLGGDGSKWHRTTINLDDLSTHFGCGLAAEEEKEEEKELKNFLSQTKRTFRLTDYTGAQNKSSKILEYYNLVRRKRTSTGAVEFEPHKLIIGVIVVLSSIAGLILIIVYIVVPHVERIVINYHDQLTIGQSTEIIVNACELTTTEYIESEWEQISRGYRGTNNGNIMTDNEVTLDS